MKKTKYFALYLLVLTLFVTCKKDDKPNTPQPTPPSATFEKTKGVPGEIISINHNLTLTAYSASFYGKALSISNAGSALSFIVPDTLAGIYQIDLVIDNNNFSLNLEVLQGVLVPNPAQYLTDLMDELNEEIQKNNAFKDSLVANGYLSAATVSADAIVWGNLQSQADAEFAGLTPVQKQELANYIEANRYWLDFIDELSPNQFGFGKTNSNCEGLRQTGLQALDDGKTFTAARIAVKFKWCQALEAVDAKTDNIVSKAKLLWDNTSHPWATVTLMNLIGRKIEKLANEIDNIGNSEFVADEMQDWGELKNTLTWTNGEIKPIFTKIKFRAPLKSDIGTAGTLGDFAQEFDNFIQAYADHVNNMNIPLVWRPEFRTNTRVIDFNRDLSIPKSSINNPEVILVNTQVSDDNWEVIFATDDSADHNFTFDIVYDDGNVSIAQTFDASVFHSSGQNISIVDPRDGQTYAIVKIGSQWWFAENLRYSGIIPQVTGIVNWAAIWNNRNPTEQPAWCYYEDNAANDTIFGKLYNWYAVNTGNLCPIGWHIPTKTEWTQLSIYLGGFTIAGGKMKSTSGWFNNGNGTNSSGFSGLPGGYRSRSGPSEGIGENSLFWSATDENSNSNAFVRVLRYDYINFNEQTMTKSSGLTCRCIKD